MTDERRRISTLQAIWLVGIATFQAYTDGISGITVPEQQPAQIEQVSNLPPVQRDAAERDEAANKAREALHELEHGLEEVVKLKDELEEAGKQAPDPVNQAEVRPPPTQEGLSTLGPVEVYAGPYPVQDPRLTALDLKHAGDLHKLDDYTKRMEEGLKSRYEGSADLDGYLKSFGEMAEKQRESRLIEQAAERQQLRQEVYADQQRTVNQQQQYTVPVPPPTPPDLNR